MVVFLCDMMNAMIELGTYPWGNDEQTRSASDTEETTLLPPRPNNPTGPGNRLTTLVVTLLIALLLWGFAIGVYLLVLQSNEDNILPPVESMPIRRLNSSDWDESDLLVIPVLPIQAETVIVQQTDTTQCQDLDSCFVLLKEIKSSLNGNESLPCNFWLSTDGSAYEGLGWSKLSPLHAELKPLVLAFIGNFTHVYPSAEQVAMAKSLISVSLRRNFLTKNYTIIGEPTKEVPRLLFDVFADSPQWKAV